MYLEPSPLLKTVGPQRSLYANEIVVFLKGEGTANSMNPRFSRQKTNQQNGGPSRPCRRVVRPLNRFRRGLTMCIAANILSHCSSLLARSTAHRVRCPQQASVAEEVAVVAPDSPVERDGAARRQLSGLEGLGLSDAEEQMPGQPWNYQQRFDPKLFTSSTEWSPATYKLPPGECDL